MSLAARLARTGFAPVSAAALRRLRLVSGVVLLLYTTMHLAAHAFGLSSLAAQQAAGDVVDAVWTFELGGFSPMTWVLYGALLVHMALALHLVARRRRLFVFTGAEARGTWQLWLGLSLPLLLAAHVVANRWGQEIYAIRPSYEFTLASVFVFAPWQGILLAAGLVAAWVHGMLGIDGHLRFQPWFAGWRREAAIAVAVALPLAALAGYLLQGREIEYLVGDADWLAGYTERLGSPPDSVFAALARDTDAVRIGFVALVAAALGGRYGLRWMRRRAGMVEVDYQDGPRVRVAGGPTLLDISRDAGVPHASVCGGRGRCSTCRVRVLEAAPSPPLREPDERRLLQRAYRAHASERGHAGQRGPMSGDVPDDVRLACRWRPEGHVRVSRLLPADAGMEALGRGERGLSGDERPIAVMFADLRGFTTASEGRLPFDTVYLINAFARVAGQAVEAEGGRVDKFLGDGVMALFGAEGHDADPAGHALRAALRLLDGVEALGERLAADLDGPLGVAIGLHHGPAIVGEIGYGAARGLTAIGDTVNTAARLETVAKDHDAALAVSRAALEAAGLGYVETEPVDIRGRTARLDVACLSDKGELERMLHVAV